MAAPRSVVKHLHALRNVFGAAAAAEKSRLLNDLKQCDIETLPTLKLLHQTLLFLRAFPDSAETLALATRALDSFQERVAALPATRGKQLDDTGIAGTTIHYRYSLDVARWLVKHCPGNVEIDWPDFENTQVLDEILSLMLAPAEDTAFSEGDYSTQEWLDIARGDSAGTDFDWLIRQMQSEGRLRATGKDLYEDADLPVAWKLGDCAASITRNRLNLTRVVIRKGMRRLPANPGRMIATPLAGIRLLTPKEGRIVIDVAQAALVARHREVFSMNVGDPAEVWLAPLGEGAYLAVFGVVRESRPVVEGNYGYLLLSNGVPIGYGGVSPLFAQGNTGINIFEEYRGSEAAFLFAQTLRTFRTLFGCDHFIANPYQFGAGNAEAIGSGAFWFYYRFGFRPVDADVRKLAEREYRKVSARRGYRSDKQTLRALARGDLILSLPGAKRSTFFPERRLIQLSEGATRLIAAHTGCPRRRAVERVVEDVAKSLGVRSRARWLNGEQDGFERLAPLAALVDELATWSAKEKRALVDLMRAKGGRDGRRFAQLLKAHRRLQSAWTRYCAKRA
ncbi:MAG: hypothetical protein H6818_09165 [Phycisphaerales bacterium]|nr:hypothetical protein [Phycisphaerales bacterium]MCB9862740.1 hypothetical protein [Phycisphaerales bacterium]